jgi:hypothetical protein
MKLTKTELMAWEATAIALQEIDPNELDLLPEIVEAFHEAPAKIGGVPGAFDFDVNAVQSAAIAIFGVVVACIKDISPKLVDASIDVGKDYLKKSIDHHTKVEKTSVPPEIDSKKIHQIIRTAVLEHRIGIANADSIANAVVFRLSLPTTSNSPKL